MAATVERACGPARRMSYQAAVRAAKREASTLPPLMTTPSVPPRARARPASTAARARRAAGLGHDLHALEEQSHGVDDLGIADGDDVVDERADHLPGQFARDGDLLAVGDRLGNLHRHALAGTQRARHVVAGLGLDTNHAHLRPQRLDRRRHPGDQPAAADRDHHRVEVLDVGGELEPDGALAGHHEGVVVGVHERQPAFGGERAGERLTVVGVAVELDDLRAVALGGGTLGRRRVAWHEDRRPRPVLARGEGQRLGVVARGDRAHAVGAQRGHGVEGAAELEGACALEVLGLQSDRGTDSRVERARAQQGRAVRDAVEARGGRVHVLDRDRQRRGRGHCAAWWCSWSSPGTCPSRPT